MNTIPAELLILIVHELYRLRNQEVSPDIRSLMLVEKRLYNIAKPYLYRHLEPQYIGQPLYRSLINGHLASQVQRFHLMIDSDASALDFDILSLCTSVKRLKVTWYFDEATQANTPSNSEWMLRKSVEQLQTMTRNHQLEHIHIKTLGTMYPVWDPRSRDICEWICDCQSLRTFVAELEYMGTWRFIGTNSEGVMGVERRETSLLGFIEDLAYFGSLSIDEFEWWSMSRGGLFRDRHDLNDPAIRQLLQPVKTLRLLISDPWGAEALVSLIPLFPSVSTIRLLHNPRFQTLPASFMNLIEPMSDLPNLKTVEVDMEATLDPESGMFAASSLFGGFSLFLLGCCKKLETVRLLFDSNPLHRAGDPVIFEKVWRFLNSTTRKKRLELAWEMHVLPASEIQCRTYWSERDSLWVRLKGEKSWRSSTAIARGPLVDSMMELDLRNGRESDRLR